MVCKAKDNNKTDLLIDRLLSYLYTWWFVNNLFYEHERKISWNTASYDAAIISHIAIVHDFFLTPSFYFQLQTILIGQQSDNKQPIKLTHAIANLNKAIARPPIDIRDDKHEHSMEIKGRSTELGGGRIVEDSLKHGVNLRLKLQRGLELRVWLYSNYPIYYIDLIWL